MLIAAAGSITPVPMFDGFTDRAKKVMGLAREAAVRLRHDATDAPHILLGIAEESTGVAANVLQNLGVSMQALRERLARDLAPDARAAADGSLPLTTHAQALLTAAHLEAHGLGHNFIGTEHLLLGALRDARLATTAALQDLGLQLERTRLEIRQFLGMTGDADAAGGIEPARRRDAVVRGTAVVLGPHGPVQAQLVLPALREAGFTTITNYAAGPRLPHPIRPALQAIERAELVVIAAVHEPLAVAFLIGVCQALECLPILVVEDAAPAIAHPDRPVFAAGRPPFEPTIVHAFVAMLQRHRIDPATPEDGA